MAFKEHPVFKPAPTKESKLWRYMNLPKYLSLLQKKALYLVNLELLSRGDPFEGSLPNSRFIHRNWESVDDVTEEILTKLKKTDYGGPSHIENKLVKYKELAEFRIKQTMVSRKSYFINCWHLSEYESSAMWDIYSRKNEGIAIISSESNLIEAFENTSKEIYGGKVGYGDYFDNDFIFDEGNAFVPILNKRNSFSYENEYRIVFKDTTVTHKEISMCFGNIKDKEIIIEPTKIWKGTTGKTIDEIENEAIKPGYYIECDITKLIKEIYISPLAEDWFFEMVNEITTMYEINVPIKKSPLLSEPLQ